ncbi:serine hydrolase domain-containing protein [Micromonospora sp. CPCC 206060]|uniref:serine hydrolase domain-containing protein n=1 Tax=Micromonospora sp. CPCC 206060 TaxID=3122406 RepID=UPI002FF3F86C
MPEPTRTVALLTTLAVTGGAAAVVAGDALVGAPAAAAAPAARCPIAPSQPTTLPELSAERLRAALGTLPDAEVSAALVQIRGSAGCWQDSEGIADTRSHRPVPPDARFRIGSMTKVFTAVVALQLVAEGRLDLDRSVQHYLPGLLPADYPTITVRQVLSYTSGLNGVGVPHKDPDWFLAHRYDHWAPGSQLDLTRPPLFTPGSRQRYANADYWLAGLLIERVTGNRWDEEVTERIIRPLHLTGTSAPVDDPRIHGPHVRGYEVIDGRWVDVTEANPSLQWSAAAMISTAGDLDRLLVELFGGRLVPPAQLELMFTVPDVPAYDGDDDPTNDRPAEYGMGLSRYRMGALTIWGKSGDRPGYNSGFGATRDLSRRLVYSVNTLHMGGEQPDIAQRIIVSTFF